MFICKARSLYYRNLNVTGHFWTNSHWWLGTGALPEKSDF